MTVPMAKQNFLTGKKDATFSFRSANGALLMEP
jgi:hypothetical protein